MAGSFNKENPGQIHNYNGRSVTVHTTQRGSLCNSSGERKARMHTFNIPRFFILYLHGTKPIETNISTEGFGMCNYLSNTAFSFSNSRTGEDVEFSASPYFLRALLKPNTMNRFVRVRSDSAPPCNQSTLDKEVP